MHGLIHGAGGSAAAADPPLPRVGHGPRTNPLLLPRGLVFTGDHTWLFQVRLLTGHPAGSPRLHLLRAAGGPLSLGAAPSLLTGMAASPPVAPSLPPCRISADFPALPASWLRARRRARVMLVH